MSNSMYLKSLAVVVMLGGMSLAASPNSQPVSQQRIYESIYVLRDCTITSRIDQWVDAIKELTEIGNASVPALTAELDRTQSDATMRAIAFTLRVIGDPRAVPCLIRALAKTPAVTSDYGLLADDIQFAAFMNDNQTDKDPEPGRFNYNRAVRQVNAALEKMTGHSEGNDFIKEQTDNPKDVNEVRKPPPKSFCPLAKVVGYALAGICYRRTVSLRSSNQP